MNEKITSTVKINRVTLIAMNMNTATPCFPVVIVKGNPNDTEKLLKSARKAWDNPGIVLCGVKSVEIVEKKYSAPLDVFMQNAHTVKDGESKNGLLTRTVKVNRVTLIAMNMNTATPCFPVVIVKGNPNDTEKLLKSARKAWDNPGVVLCGVKSVETESTCYGMTLEKFVHFADEVIE